MYVRETGQLHSPAILLLHGQVLDGSVYEQLAARLAPARRVITPDLPGYGRSPLLEPYSLAAVREAIESELGARGIGSVAVVAWSLGAYHALAMALAQRVTITRLVLLAPLAGADQPVKDAFRGYAQAVRNGTQVGPVFAQLAMPPAYAAANPELAARIAAAGDAVPPATYVAEFEAIADLADLRPRLAEIRAPALVRAGDADQNVPLPMAREVSDGIPGARLEVVPGCGHLLLHQDAAATIESVVRFLG